MDAILQTTLSNAIFVNENVRILIEISLKFIPKGPITNIPALVQVMAWRRPGDKPLSEPMMVCLPAHICVTRPQWVIGIPIHGMMVFILKLCPRVHFVIYGWGRSLAKYLDNILSFWLPACSTQNAPSTCACLSSHVYRFVDIQLINMYLLSQD